MIRKLSPAKINLCLRVLRRREDGYHDIASLMQRISLADEMTFAFSEGGITVRCPGSPLPEKDGNIVYRAAQALFSAAACRSGGIDITIHKKIPLAAGLGGGSSNAATTLLTLNELFAFRYTAEDLMKIGAKLGADVPFFIFQKTAWAFGIGERLEAAENLPSFSLVLINPRFELSTKMIYEGLKLRLTNRIIHYSIPRFYTIHDLAEGLQNDLERVSVRIHPVLSDLKRLLIEHGALGALMSGSGPTVFGIFETEEMAATAQKALSGIDKWSVFSANAL